MTENELRRGAVVQFADTFGPDDELPDAGTISGWAEAALGDLDAYACVRIVDAGEIKALNARYRGSDKPTNVLAFPVDLPADLPADLDDGCLGDIAICASVVEAEALAQHKPVDAHWAHLVVHGVLHLLGHDHDAPGPQREMEQREVEILASLGYEDPYQARTKV